MHQNHINTVLARTVTAEVLSQLSSAIPLTDQSSEPQTNAERE